MCFMATIVRPLRSKRARISPVRRRSKASGFTRIRVRSIDLLSGQGAGGREDSHPCAAGRAGRFGAAGTGAARLGRRLTDFGLAVGADLPARIQRAGADGAGFLEAAQAARAAQEVVLHVVPAVGALGVLQAREPRLGRRDLELALAHVLEVL